MSESQRYSMTIDGEHSEWFGTVATIRVHDADTNEDRYYSCTTNGEGKWSLSEDGVPNWVTPEGEPAYKRFFREAYAGPADAEAYARFQAGDSDTAYSFASASSQHVNTLGSITPEQLAKWQQKWQQKWDDMLAGKHWKRVRTNTQPPDQHSNLKHCGACGEAAVAWNAGGAWCEECYEQSTGERVGGRWRAVAKRALSLVQRMARGYDWSPAEVDALEADCRQAGITE